MNTIIVSLRISTDSSLVLCIFLVKMLNLSKEFMIKQMTESETPIFQYWPLHYRMKK